MTASNAVIDAALAQVDRGFAVFALGHNTKIPVTEHGFKNATRNPDWVRTQLQAASAGNYGMIWPTDSERIVVAFDLDNGDGATETWEGRLQRLMDTHGWLPATKATTTPSGGRHAFFTWPSDVPIPPGDELFGFTVRWPGRGYLVGPGSSIDGREYQAGATDEIAELPRAWVDAAIAERRASRQTNTAHLITITGGYELPDVIPSGRRYATVRDYVASRYNSGLKKPELWALVVSEVAPRFADPKTELELRRDFERVMAKITERLGAPAKAMAPSDAVAAVRPIDVVPLSQIATEAVPWLWHRYLPIGSITLFDGNPGEGKSTIVADLIARITNSNEWPDGSSLEQTGTVLYVTKEDDPSTQVRPRIEVAGGDVSRVMFVATDLLFPRDAGRFRELLADVKPVMVMLDPLMSYLEGKVRAISDNEVRSAIMTPLAELAREQQCAMLVIRHFAKTPGQSALNKGAGSLGGLAGAARMVLALASDPQDDDDRTRVFGVVKSNYEAKPPSLRAYIEAAPVEGFQMTVSRVRWLGTSETSVVDLMERSKDDQHQLIDVKDALRAVLDEAPEPMSKKDVEVAMAARGFKSKRLVDQARHALRVVVKRQGFPSQTYWSLPLGSVSTDELTAVSTRELTVPTGDDAQSVHPELTVPTGDEATSDVQSVQSVQPELTGASRSRTRGRAQEARSDVLTEREGGVSGAEWSVEGQSAQSVHVSSPLRARSREAEQPVEVVATEADWVEPCRDYTNHQDHHHRTKAGWICDICSPGVAA